MLTAVTGPVIGAPVAVVWLRRLAVLLAVIVALTVVRGPACVDTGHGGPTSASMAVGETAGSVSPFGHLKVEGSSPTQAVTCPVSGLSGGSPADQQSCIESAPPAAVGASGEMPSPVSRNIGDAWTYSTHARTPVGAELPNAAGLHRLGHLRT